MGASPVLLHQPVEELLMRLDCADALTAGSFNGPAFAEVGSFDGPDRLQHGGRYLIDSAHGDSCE